MGKEYLVEGAQLMCIHGGEHTFLQIPKGHGYTSGGKKKANCLDCVAGENIQPFGTCAKNEGNHQCEGYMQLVERWESMSTSTAELEKVNGEDALTMDSVLLCRRGGLILPLTSGQGYDKGVDWEAFTQRFAKMMTWVAGKNLLCHIFGGDPINLNTGNFIYEKEDLKIEGISPLSFKLLYNAMEKGRGGVLGQGWHHNQETRIQREDERLLYLCLGDGRKLPYRRGLGDIYTPVFGDEGLIGKEEKGYCYHTKGGEEYIFNEEGLLQSRQDRRGGRDTYSYNEKGQLIQVRGANGGQLFYRYNKEDKLIEVKDHTGREVRLWYRYGKLYQYVNACGQTYTYEYNVNGRLESVLTPRGILGVKNTYDGVNRIVKQETPDGGILEMAYDDVKRRTFVTEPGGRRIIYESDERFRNIRTIYEDGEEQYAYNDRNQRTLYVDKLGNKTRYRYDEKGNLTQLTNAIGEKTAYQYDANSRLLSIRKPNGAVIENKYDNQGNLIERKNSGGHKRLFSYDDKNRLIQITQEDQSIIRLQYDIRGNVQKVYDAQGNKTEYEYDALNRIIAIHDGNGGTEQFVYDNDNLIIEKVDALGYRKKIKRNEHGKIVSIQEDDGSFEEVEYDECNRIIQYTDKEKNVTRFKRDERGNKVEELLPNGGCRYYLYDKANQVISSINELGYETKYEYDANGNCTKIIKPEELIIVAEYDGLNRVSKVIHPDGETISYQYGTDNQVIRVQSANHVFEEKGYDLCGNLHKEKDFYGNITEYHYNRSGLLSSVCKGELKTEYEYFPGGLLKKITQPDGTWNEFTYDGKGNLISDINQEGYILTYTYDLLDRVLEAGSNIGEKTKFEYDSLGRIAALTDGNGNVRRYRYSPNGNLLEVKEANTVSRYAYDGIDKLILVEQIDLLDSATAYDAGNRLGGHQKHITEYKRDLAGNLIEVVDALGNVDSYSYDSEGRILCKADREGNKTSYTYDYRGKIKTVEYADGKTVEYQYDELRNLIRMTDWLGETKIENDEYGRVVNITDHNSNKIGFAYGERGERKAIIYPDGERVDYQYDRLGRLIQVDTFEGIINYRYNQNGRLERKELAGSIRVDYTYDKAGRVSGITSRDSRGIIDRFLYQYDAVGNKVGIQKSRRGMISLSGEYRYLYDASNRLCGVEKDGEILRSYTYDGYGNRIQMRKGEEEYFYSYNSLNQLLAVEGSRKQSYFYDKRGNLISQYNEGEKFAEYAYDATNRLEASWQKGGVCSRYSYNGLGHRVSRERKEPTKEGILQHSLLEEYIIDLTKGCHNLLWEKRGEDTRKYIWDDTLLLTQDGQGNKYVLTDDAHTPIRFLFCNGMVSRTYDYDEFGNLQYGDWNDGQPFGFTGYRKEEPEGQYFGQAREYHGAEGRFVNEDIFGGMLSILAALNRYVYCYQNPLIYWDPWGYFTTVEGKEAHEQLQHLVDEMYPGRVKTEYEIKEGYAYSPTGVGIVDIYFPEFNGQPGEVYEIKPISQYGRENLYYPGGLRQREGYIAALQKKKENVSDKATIFNPNGWTVPSLLHTDKNIRYYTFSDREGMIYWGYVNKPKPEPEPASASVPDEEKEYRIDGGAVGEALVTTGLALLFILELVVWLYRLFQGIPAPVPRFATSTCF